MQTQPDDESIRMLAYHIWEQRGRPAGDAEADWKEAERALQSRDATLPSLD